MTTPTTTEPTSEQRAPEQTKATPEQMALVRKMGWGERGAEISTFEDAWRMCQVFASSRMFRDIEAPGQAMVKMQVGAELGFSPMASLINVFIIEGRPGVGASMILAKIIKEGGRPKIKTWDPKSCVIEWSRKWPGSEHEKAEVVGESSFTIEEAKVAGLLDRKGPGGGPGTWVKYPKAMLYSRTVTQGARTYFPDLFMGAIYDVDEVEEIREERALNAPNGAGNAPPVAAPGATGSVEAAPKKARRGPSGSEKLAAAAAMVESTATTAAPTGTPPPLAPLEPDAVEPAPAATAPADEELDDDEVDEIDEPVLTPAATTAPATTTAPAPAPAPAAPSVTTEAPPPGAIADPPATGATLTEALKTQPTDATGVTKHFSKWNTAIPIEDQETFKIASRRALNLAGKPPKAEWYGISAEMQAIVTAALVAAGRIKPT